MSNFLGTRQQGGYSLVYVKVIKPCLHLCVSNHFPYHLKRVDGKDLFTLCRRQQPLPCKGLHLVPRYRYVMSTFDDTKIMKNMPLPLQCEKL